MLWLLAILVSAFLALREWKLVKFKELSNKIASGIKSYTFIGHAYLFIGDGENRMKMFLKFGREAIRNGGMTSLWLGGKLYIVAVDAVDLDVIMKTSLEKDNVMRFARNLIGNGLIFAPVAIWRPRRKILAPTFNPKNLNNFMPVFNRQSSVLVEKLNKVAGKGAVSMWDYFNTLSFDSVCETTLGIKMNNQRNPHEPFLYSFGKVCQLIAARMVQPWMHSDTVYKLLPDYADFERNKGVVCKFIDEAIRSKRNALNENCSEENHNLRSEMKSFLELLLESSGYTDLELHEETLVIVVAGTDTSAVAGSFVISMMARHPHIQDKVAQEIQEVLGREKKPVLASDLPRLKYLEAVIKETLRLYPPVPVIVREIEQDLELPSGITLIKGCGVLVNVWATHRNAKYWGNDAEIFRPERFLEAAPHPAAYLAFSHGPRSCMGYQYAMISMKTALSTFLRSYRVLNIDDRTTDCHKPMKVSFDIMMKDVDGFQVKLEKRTNC